MPDEKPTNPINEVILRSYPKVIFFYPLLFMTLILWPIQALAEADAAAALLRTSMISIIGSIWFIMFFVNMFVIAFDFSSTKFFILVLAIVVVILLLVFLVDWGSIGGGPAISVNLGLPSIFYAAMSGVLGFILLFVIIGNQFSYYKVERNEIYYKRGITGSAERFPVKSLRIHKEIPDIFEFLFLRAGSITLVPSKDKVIMLNTVLNVNKKADQIDELLSRIRVEIDDHV